MRHRNRRGFTLIEVLVVIAIVGILVALILPAVQAAREAARRLGCANNLKQIGLAIHQHVESRGHYPGGYGQPYDASYLVQILPFVEQSNLYNSINIEASGGPLSLTVNENLTVLTTRLSSFICTSDDSRKTIEVSASPSYAANAGSNPISGEGVFIGQGLSPRDVTDGQSQTAAVAEWIVGSGNHKSRREAIYNFGAIYGSDSRRAYAQRCDSLVLDRAQLAALPNKGVLWTTGGLGRSQYNHVLPINSPSCNDLPWYGIAAGSLHPGGANCLKLDGSVRFIRETIDPDIWYSHGTRSGGEIIGADALQ